MPKWDKSQKEFLKKLGENIVRIRKEKGVASKEIYEDIEMDRSNYRRIEAGRTNPSTLILKKICDKLGVSVSDIFNI